MQHVEGASLLSNAPATSMLSMTTHTGAGVEGMQRRCFGSGALSDVSTPHTFHSFDEKVWELPNANIRKRLSLLDSKTIKACRYLSWHVCKMVRSSVVDAR